MLIVIEVQRTAWSPVQYSGRLYFRGHEVGREGACTGFPEQCMILRIDVVRIIY